MLYWQKSRNKPRRVLLLTEECSLFQNPPAPFDSKGLHLSFVFPPLREGKKQKVAETDNFLWVLVSGYGPDEILRYTKDDGRWTKDDNFSALKVQSVAMQSLT